MANNSKARFVARDFITQTEGLLNKTICSNVNLTAVDRETFMVVACGISKQDLTPQLIPVALGEKKAKAFLNLSYRFDIDPDQGYLRVASSFFGVCTGAEKEQALCHFDYERGKSDGYPEAHIQVHGTNSSLATLNKASDSGRTLDKLHFPVGGRRFRPSLEDVIEFLVVERIADPHEGWREVLTNRRTEYQSVQLKAAIRRDPETARRALDELAYVGKVETVSRPGLIGRRRRK